MTLHEAIQQFIKHNASIYEPQYDPFLSNIWDHCKDNLVEFVVLGEDEHKEEQEEEEQEEEEQDVSGEENINNNIHNMLLGFSDISDNGNNNDNGNGRVSTRVASISYIEEQMRKMIRKIHDLSHHLGELKQNPPQDMITSDVRSVTDTRHVCFIYIYIYILCTSN